MTKPNGLDPNSAEMVSYINSSKGKNGWEKIDKEIGGFKKIIDDESRPDGERIDAKGYFLICQFKILANLTLGTEEEKEKKFQELKDKEVFSKYFGLDDSAATLDQIYKVVEKSALQLAEEHKDKETFPDKSVLNSAYAVLIKLPMYDVRLSLEEKDSAVDEKCKQYAKAHFDSAQEAAELGKEVGNGRGYVFLKTAYDFMRRSEAYKRESQNINSKEELQILKQECEERSAECRNLQSYGDLGEVHLKKGESEEAEKKLRVAADAGFGEFQYRLGVLLYQKGEADEGKKYLQDAMRNEFDVEGKLKEDKGQVKGILSKEIIFGKALMDVSAEKSKDEGRV